MKPEARPTFARRRSAKIDSTEESVQMATSVGHKHNHFDSLNAHSDTNALTVTDSSLEQNYLEVKMYETSDVLELKQLLVENAKLLKRQAQILEMRENQIDQLKQENENLRACIERMERRSSTMKAGGINSPMSPSRVLTPTKRHINSNKALKRWAVVNNWKTSSEQQGLVKRFVSLSRSEYTSRSENVPYMDSYSGGELTRDTRKSVHYSPRMKRRSFKRRYKSKLTLPRKSNGLLVSSPRKRVLEGLVPMDCPSRYLRVRNASVSSTGHRPTEGGDAETVLYNSSGEMPVSLDSEDSRTDGSVRRKRRKVNKIETVRERRLLRSLPKDEDIMKTTKAYYVQPTVKKEKEVKRKKPAKENVLVPSFRIKTYTPYYVIDGRENFEDEVYIERHKKPESDEKKRKRWDLQQQREEEQRHRLLCSSRYQDHSKPATPTAASSTENSCDTLLPDPNNIKFIEVCDELPVSVFGYPLPNVECKDFSLPWFDIEKLEKEQCKKATRHCGRKR